MIKLIELFGGIGTQTMAFERLQNKFGKIDCVDLVEWDQKSVDIYNRVHKTTFLGGPGRGDVNNVRGSDIGSNTRQDPSIDKEPVDNRIIHNGKDIWVMTCSSPCQSLSNAGIQDGMAPLINEKSSFLWEGIRILRECYELDPVKHTRQPHYFIIENVTPIHNKANNGWFNTVLRQIEAFGYNTYVMDVNGNDVGQPQMRARTFVVAALKGVGLKKYIPFKGKAFEDDTSTTARLSKLVSLFDSTSMEDIKEEDSVYTKAHKVIIYDGNTHKGIRVTSKYGPEDKDDIIKGHTIDDLRKLAKKIKDNEADVKQIADELKRYGYLFDEYRQEDENKIKELKDEILDYVNQMDMIKAKTHTKEYSEETTSLADYPFLVKEGLTEEPIKEYAVIDISFQSKKGAVDPAHCKVYKDKFPTLLCNTDHILILDPKHNCMRRILAKEAWLLQTYTDDAFNAARDISLRYAGDNANLSALYQSLHKTAGDAILVDAFVKVLEPLSTTVSPDDVASPEAAAAETPIEDSDTEVEIPLHNKQGDVSRVVKRNLRPSQVKTYEDALNIYNKLYNQDEKGFVPPALEGKYTAPAKDTSKVAPYSNIFKPYSKDDIQDLGFEHPDENAFEESFKKLFNAANLLREAAQK